MDGLKKVKLSRVVAGCRGFDRKGSALLIVLGMLAFMVISAVAFSAYMRFARLPSSFLRRSVASRLLVKAAMARALDEIDAAIGNNPHPGVGDNKYYFPRNQSSPRGTSYQWNRNHWKQRVYMGGTNDNNRVPMLPQNRTVSPLCLEALAYLPPSIVNEVRYYSRHSPAAEWHEMDYDSGRYAFCAVDVSDYFDINVVHADFPRLSSAGSRVSLSYLFENEDHSAMTPLGGMCSAAAWDDFMSKFRPNGGPSDAADTSGSKLPLISLADFNLALHALKPGLESPFCTFVEQNKGNFYGFSESGPDAERIRRMTFVTDSYCAPTNSTDVLDLSDDANQPFKISDLIAGSTSKDWYSIAGYEENGAADQELKRFLCGFGKCQLFDYLDKDIIPTSLALPTLERTPMICGIDMNSRNGALKVSGKGEMQNLHWIDNPPQPGGKCGYEYKVSYKISGLPNAPVQTLLTYPFRNGHDSQDDFQVGGRVSYFLTAKENGDIGLRTENENDHVHLKYRIDDPLKLNEFKMIDKSIMVMPLRAEDVSPSRFDASKGEEGAVLSLSLNPNGKLSEPLPYLEIVYEVTTRDDPNAHPQGQPIGGNPPVPVLKVPDIAQNGENDNAITIKSSECAWVPLAPDNNGPLGREDANFVDDFQTKLLDKEFVANLKLNMAVWLWIKDKSSGKVVDLVPACGYDDEDLNSLNAGRSAKRQSARLLGQPFPLMRFDMTQNGDPIIEFNARTISVTGSEGSSIATQAAGQLKSWPKAVYVGDPRFNHAPEDWFYEDENGTISPSDWIAKCGCRGVDGDVRDGDIFMQTSDVCYLQSLYELSNLLYLQRPSTSGGDTRGSEQGFYDNPGMQRTGFAKGFKSAQHWDLMWVTYDPVADSRSTKEDVSRPAVDFEDTKFVSAKSCFRVNPYAETNTLIAAFANTPLEWSFAADSDRTDGQVKTVSDNASDAKQFNSRYAWNEYSTGNAKMDWVDLTDFVAEFRNRLRERPDEDWRDVYDDLGWYDASHRQDGTASKYLINDIEVNSNNKNQIYNCDRKFLYGFWRECLAPQQQLFLVFVRAEPMMMGGGMAGAIPPSLGARAMALVWRDPTPTQESSAGKPAPHRMRTLFYRQFD